jgi:hypothetical protein
MPIFGSIANRKSQIANLKLGRFMGSRVFVGSHGNPWRLDSHPECLRPFPNGPVFIIEWRFAGWQGEETKQTLKSQT